VHHLQHFGSRHVKNGTVFKEEMLLSMKMVFIEFKAKES